MLKGNDMLARKLLRFFLCNSVANATLNCIENKIQQFNQKYKRLLQIREAMKHTKKYKSSTRGRNEETNYEKYEQRE
jgi:hypothetical protein